MKQLLRSSLAINRGNLAPAILLGAGVLCGSIAMGQNLNLPTHTLSDKVVTTASMKDADAQECTINNLQGSIATGTLNLYSVPGQGVSTYFDPAGTAEPGDPGCFISDPYPFTIESVQLNAFAAGGFGIPAAEGVGTFEYEVSIVSATDDGTGCNFMGDELFSSPVQTFTVTTTTNQYPSVVPVALVVNEPFFVVVKAVSWTGASNRSPSAVLWSNIGIDDCRQYTITIVDGAETITDHNISWTTNGWHNVIVNGSSPDATGNIDIAVSDLTADAEMTQSIPSTVTAMVSNLGEVDIAGIDVVLTANGTTVQTIPVNLLAGGSTEVSFTYTPAVTGSVELVVSTSETGDVDEANNSVSTTVNVNPPADPCIFSDDIESYALGGVAGQGQWTTWTGAPAENPNVTTAFANSGTQSVETVAATDALYLLGNQAAGTWKIGFSLYIPEGNGGYFNIQKTQTPGQEFALEVILQNTGVGTINVGTLGAATFNFDQGTWNDFEIVINIESDVANLLLNGDLVHQWQYSIEANSTTPSLTTIGAVNFYPAGATAPLMYIDDVSFCQYYNNAPCEAFELIENMVVVGDNTDATPYDDTIIPGTDCWSDPIIDGDVWYTFEVPADGTYLVTTNLEVLENDDTQILVFTSSDDTCAGELTQIGCGDDVSSTNYLTEVDLIDLTAGTVIWILVDGWQGAIGTFQIAVQSSAGPMPPVNDLCADATDISGLTGGAMGEVQTSDVFTNVDATVDSEAVGSCFDDETLDLTTWYTFTGDGNNYYIQTGACNAVNPIPFDDTQLAIYTGDCENLVEVACVEDIDFAGQNYAAGLEFAAEEGVEYTIMIDSWGNFPGEFCISFENMGLIDATVDASVYGFKLYPNPATNDVRIQADQNMTNILILNSLGQLVKSVDANSTSDILIDVNQFATGLYFVQATIDGQIVTTKLNVQ